MDRALPPAPPRSGRILAWRWIVVALVAGVVLAVGSVPVGAVVGGLPVAAAVGRERAGYFYADNQIVVFERAWSPASEVWSTLSAPYSIDEQVLARFEPGGIALVESGVLPPMARTTLDGTVRTRMHYRAGWPWRSAGGVVTTFPLPPVPFVGVWRPTTFGRSHTIPYLPLWPGLVGNMLFYALLVLASVALVRGVRLRRRARRNQCLACGYELGAGVQTCPECGLAPVRAPGERG